MNKNQKLNTLVTIYRETRDEDVFNEIYAKTIGKVYGKLETIGKSIRADVIRRRFITVYRRLRRQTRFPTLL
jgi:hypothetical protein